ncbi:MAG: SurA N-terminal domain-containing protein [Paramuribaculum sp.]|nr:SurA N-terminal domain-containing protein [Paramuribaculum sp.]
MATLEKIRSKSVLLLVIIGLALLAFIIGDFFTSGRTLFGTGTTIAKVGGQKIDVQDFQRRVEQENQQLQQRGEKYDQAVLQQRVLYSMVSEKLMQKELEDLGLKVTSDELTDAMLGSGSFYLDAMLRQQGIESARALHDMAYNPVNYGIDEQSAAQLRQYWQSLEQQMETSLLQQKFNTLLQGTLTANELDAKAVYDENAATAQIAYVIKDYASLSDDEYPVSDAEVKEEWNRNKSSYRLDMPQRAVNYIAVDIVPSAEDLAAAEVAVEEALVALNEQPATEGLVEKPQFVVNRNKVSAASILDSRMKSFADSASVGKAALVSRIGNDFTLAKLVNRTVETDSVNVTLFAVAAPRATADSLIRELNAGKISVDSLSGVAGVQSVQKDLDISLLDPQAASVRDAISTASIGTFFTPDTISQENILVLKVNSRKAPVAVYDLAEIRFSAEPSRATINKLEADLQTFINNNKTAEQFVANAAEAGYQVFPAIVSASTPQLNGINASRDAVHWAMEAKKGQVSPILGEETDGRFIALALNDIYKDYIPATNDDVKQYLTSVVRNNKKAAAIIEKYNGKGKNVVEYAQVMDSKVDTAMVNFGQVSPYVPGIGGGEFAAVVSVTEPGKLTGPVKANNGVIVFNIIAVDNEGRPYNYEENAMNFNRTRGAAVVSDPSRLSLLLLGNKKVENNMLKFFRD